ncbi:Uncharacterized protein PHSC3_001442 [Chlamydiales bacterium STE3]|nr:Uncharacterized protein PHSC3_001442 [Chlamydiales bacterium STE3]
MRNWLKQSYFTITMKKFSAHLDWIDKEFENTLQLLDSWVAINSWSENLAGLNLMAEKLKDSFAKICDQTEEIVLPEWRKINAQGALTITPLGKAISFVRRPQSKRKIFFCGHMDTVFSPQSNFQTPYRIDQEKCVGPGIADMKGGLAILLLALRAFEKSPLADEIGWEVFINPDEEIGSVGSKEIIAKKAPLYEFGLLFEPAFPDGAIVGQRKGSANYTVLVKGRSAHVGRDFHLGKSAIAALARFIVNTETFQALMPGLIMNIGQLQGGGPLNIVPNLASCKINARFNESEDLYKIDQKLQAFAALENQLSGMKIEIHREATRFPKNVDKKTEILYQQFKECAALLNQELIMRPTGGVCDGNTLASAGLANLDTLGAVGGDIHTEGEYILVDSIRQRAKLLALFLLNYAEKKV